MNKFISCILVVALLSAVILPSYKNALAVADYTSMNDPKLLRFVEDQVYAELAGTLDSDDYIINNVQAIYVSQEYLDELAFNSQSNVFFGYTLEELTDSFPDSKYVFTLGSNGTTVVKPFENYDDTYERVLKNVALGTGVILVCVAVTVVTGGMGLVTTNLIFAAAAKSATAAALGSAAFGGIAAGAVKAYQTGDINQALKAAALQGSESFKWGALSGAVVGGINEYQTIRWIRNILNEYELKEFLPGTVDIPDGLLPWQEAELRALNEYGGYYQMSFLDGNQVPMTTYASSKPDVVRLLGDHLEAIEVKYYDLENSSCLNMLYKELSREISERVINLPKGSTQRIVLDVTNRDFTIETINNVTDKIWQLLDDIYPKIPIDVVGL